LLLLQESLVALSLGKSGVGRGGQKKPVLRLKQSNGAVAFN